MKNRLLIIPNSEITLWNDSFLVEKNTGELGLDLKTLGYDVSFYGQFVNSQNNIHVYDLKRNGIKVVGLSRKFFKIYNYLLLYIRVIPEIIKSNFVYIFYPTSFKFIAFLCVLLGKKYGLYIRGMEDLETKSSKLIISKADVVLSVAELLSKYSRSLNNIGHIGTIRPMIKLGIEDIVYREKKGYRNEYNVLYLGRMTNDKGIIELLYATDRIRSRVKNFKVTLVGDGEYLNELKDLAKKLNISDYVWFEEATFDQNKLKKYFEDADLFVLPTYHEGFPRTLYEAMIYGIPIITTFVGGIPSVMKEDVNCRKIIPKSIESLENVLVDAISNYSEMEILALEGTITVRDILETRKFSHAEDLNNIIKRFYD